MVYNPGFGVGAPAAQSQVIRTDQEIRQMARAAELERQRKARASAERQKAAIEQRRTDAAQTLVDSITKQGGLTWDGVDKFAYGEFVNPDTLAPGNLDPNANYADFYALNGGEATPDWRNGGTQYGSIEGGQNWIPTLDEARGLLDAWADNPRMNLSSMTGTYQTPQDVIRVGLGEDIAPQWVDYLASQTDFRAPTGGDALNLDFNGLGNFLEGGLGAIGNGPTNASLSPMDSPFMYGRSSTLNPARDTLSSLLDPVIATQNVGSNDTMRRNALQSTFGVDTNMLGAGAASRWSQIDQQLQQDAQQRAQNTAIQNDAYQRYTLGGDYAGGVLNERYSQPFGGRLEGYDPNNPMAYFGWDGSRFGSQSGPQQGGQHRGQGQGSRWGGGFGSLGGLGGQQQGMGGWGGPWGAQNAWSAF